jgi:hypothetical protein
MTIAKKGSRTILVNDVQYRWVPAPLRGCEPPMMSFLCHTDKEPSDSLLNVQMWEKHCSVVTPGVVETFIIEALKTGWDPSAKGVFQIGPDQAMRFFQGA